MSVRPSHRRAAPRAKLFRWLAAVSCLTLAVGAAQAQSASRMQRIPKSGGLAPPANALDRDQLRECVALEERTGTESDAALHAQTLLSAEKARLTALAEELDRLRPKLDRERQGAVDTFNRLVQQHKDWVAEFNAKVPDANALSERSNASLARFKSECASRPYLERDMDAIERERGGKR